jgi:signal transduction histidine kinase
MIPPNESDLEAFITADPKGRQLPTYLSQLSDQFLADQKAVSQELDSLRDNIEHIKEIIAMQQDYARASHATELVNIRGLVEDSLRINAGAMTRHGVEIIREFENAPPTRVEKHKVLQILVNLLRNAKYACDDSGRADKRLTVRAACGQGRIKISVLDNGVGILPENLTRIFNLGFTTRKGGHGFGLHGSALAAREMGGSLSVHSDGPGRGAAFTLELPAISKEDSHE